MRTTDTKDQILEIIRINKHVRVIDLTQKLQVSPQAIHRHLRELTLSKMIKKRGSAPKCVYEAYHVDQAKIPVAMQSVTQKCREILSSHPEIILITLFGSQLRGDNHRNSDIDILIWLNPESKFGRQDIWRYWDRHSQSLPWKNKLSLVVKKWNSNIHIDTLLLDFPEEHGLIYDKKNFYPSLREAVLRWRKKWHSKKISSFGGTHSWKYSTTAKKLSDIDFRLEIKNAP